ncbi:MAG: type III pantothenate kinase [bacterium]
MILTIDIGNTNIHIGLYHNEKMVLYKRWATVNGIGKKIFRNLLVNKDIDGIGIASVVPVLGNQLILYLEKNLGMKPVVICSTIKMPVKIAYRNLGADRIANIVGGFLRYRSNLIILSFGTAITCDVVSKDATHLGGIIIPGIETQLWSLRQRTALLKNMQLKPPLRILGKNTNECICSGIINGTRFSIQGFIREIKKIIGGNSKIIATGGAGKKMIHYLSEIDNFDGDLTHYGILKLYHNNA